jgi:hypothetical protein
MDLSLGISIGKSYPYASFPSKLGLGNRHKKTKKLGLRKLVNSSSGCGAD